MINTIKEKINKLIENGEIEELEPPVSIADINAFEIEFGVTLPNDLKLFYTEISNGLCIDEEVEILDFESIVFEEDYIDKEFGYKNPYIWESAGEEPNDDIYNGNIGLFELGCGSTLNLIIKGEQEGVIWNFSEVGITPLYPSMNFLELLDFVLDGGRDFFEDYED